MPLAQSICGLDLLPAEAAASVRQFLKVYVEQRINFFNSNGQPRQEVGPDPAKVQDKLWSSVVGAAGARQILYWHWLCPS
jgi:hypothetical protein